ncbi:Asd/ArgC dimerization domain-containing protein [Phaeobacter sp. C3_T13_0]|uniref:Asd/ArgC dimerization domain-containing protein n=1 Tax=Phaeobacter cretensis TaxID=3342641 RepID=UPI0039BC7D61
MTKNPKRVSIAGVCSLLGQNLLAELVESPDFIVESIHDVQADRGTAAIADTAGWQGDINLETACVTLPFLPAAAPAKAPLLLSFLPDSIGQAVEAEHISRGTNVISHCEYARTDARLLMPGLVSAAPSEPLQGTPNCTTAMCVLPLYHLHKALGVTRATITTLQAISGTDLPGLPASVIHDQVIGHLPGEAAALSNELICLLGESIPIETFATRVPVWRGHTITMSVDLSEQADAEAIRTLLTDIPGVAVSEHTHRRDSFTSPSCLSQIVNIRKSESGVSLIIKGDNLGSATVGVMRALALELQC